MDERQQQELRDWGGRLAAASDAERQAMGRAILILLAQIEALQAELDAASSPTQHQLGAEPRQASTPSTAAEAHPLDSDRFEQDRDLVERLPDDIGTPWRTPPSRLRRRVRRAARHLRPDNWH